MPKYSILGKARAADISREPFPHIVINNALDEDIYEALVREIPDTKTLADERPYENRKFGKSASELLAMRNLSPTWQAFIAYHTSRDFFLEVVSLFGKDIERLYPLLSIEKQSALASFEVVLRKIRERKREHRAHDFVMDCQIMLDDTSQGRVCRGPHVDAIEELYAGLLYIPIEQDESQGGNLCLLRTRNPKQTFPAENAIRVRRRPAELDEADVEVIAEVPYQPNTAVFFINSPMSLHKVSYRAATPVLRRHINIIGETYSLRSGGLFRILQPRDPTGSVASKIFSRASRWFGY